MFKVDLQFLRTQIQKVPFFWLALFCVVFTPLFVLPPTSEPAKVAAFLVFVGWTLWRLAREKKISLPLALLVPLATFLLWVFMSGFLSPHPWQAVFGRVSRFNNSMILFTAWAVLVVALSAGVKTAKSSIVLQVLNFCSVLIAVFGIIQSLGVGYYSGIQSLLSPSLERVPSFVGNPNFSALVVAMLWPSALLLLKTVRNKWALIYLWFSIFSAWVALGLFASRGALLAAVASCFVLLVYFVYTADSQKRLKTLVYYGGLFVGLCVLAYSFAHLYHPELQANTISSGQNNIASRFYAWNEALLMIDAKPWFGVGPGGFFSEYMRVAVDPLPQQGWFDDPHNVFLHLGATLGLPGAMTFLLLLGLAMRSALLGLRKMRSEEDVLVVLGLSGTVAFGVGGLFNPITVSLWAVFAVCIAMCFTLDEAKEASLDLPILRKLVMGMGMLLSLIGILWFVSDYSAGWSGYLKNKNQESLRSVLSAVSAKSFPSYSTAQLSRAGFLLNEIQGVNLSDKFSNESLELKDHLEIATTRDYLNPAGLLYASKAWWVYGEHFNNSKFAFAEAKSLALRAQVLSPKAPDAFIVSGYFALAEGRWEDGLEFLYRAYTIDRSSLQALQLLTIAYQREGNRDALLHTLERLSARMPFDKNLKKALSLLKESQDINAVPLRLGKLGPEL